jgi:hypothetical protein
MRLERPGVEVIRRTLRSLAVKANAPWKRLPKFACRTTIEVDWARLRRNKAQGILPTGTGWWIDIESPTISFSTFSNWRAMWQTRLRQKLVRGCMDNIKRDRWPRYVQSPIQRNTGNESRQYE